jgi:hypothetical protein
MQIAMNLDLDVGELGIWIRGFGFRGVFKVYFWDLHVLGLEIWIFGNWGFGFAGWGFGCGDFEIWLYARSRATAACLQRCGELIIHVPSTGREKPCKFIVVK